MKISKRQLKRIIREEKRRLQEAGDIYPRPQHPMTANAGKQMKSQRIESIADELMMSDYEMSEQVAKKVAEMILNRLEQDGLI